LRKYNYLDFRKARFAVNRANAKRGTGAKTEVGRLRSSRKRILAWFGGAGFFAAFSDCSVSGTSDTICLRAVALASSENIAIDVGLKGENPEGLNCFRSRPARERSLSEPIHDPSRN
jgi:hypothetical protein